MMMVIIRMRMLEVDNPRLFEKAYKQIQGIPIQVLPFEFYPIDNTTRTIVEPRCDSLSDSIRHIVGGVVSCGCDGCCAFCFGLVFASEGIVWN